MKLLQLLLSCSLSVSFVFKPNFIRTNPSQRIIQENFGMFGGVQSKQRDLQISSTPSGRGGDSIENPMNPERFTEKAWDAFAKLPQYCDKYGQQYVEATFLLKGLLDDGAGGLAQRILVKAGVDVERFDK